MDVRTAEALGEVVVNVQIVRLAEFSRPADLACRPPEFHEKLKSATAALSAMDGLELVEALIEYTRATGVRLKI